jgi:CubicO group peptidase (beta-lactamase class C family)
MHQPGELWQYNASGLVVGVLVARAAKQSLPDFLQARVCGPLGMTSTGFWTTTPMPTEYLTDVETGKLGPYQGTPAESWARPPAFPSGASGLVSTIDDYFNFAKMLRDGGHGLLSPTSIDLMTTNQLTSAQIAAGGMLLNGRGWGLGMSVAVTADEVSQNPGRYGWEGGSGTSWFNDPRTGITAVLMTQTSDVLFNGMLNEFGRLAIEAAG